MACSLRLVEMAPYLVDNDKVYIYIESRSRTETNVCEPILLDWSWTTLGYADLSVRIDVSANASEVDSHCRREVVIGNAGSSKMAVICSQI